MTVVILHLSDIHIRLDNDWILDRGEDIAACVYSALPDAAVVFVLVSGDIAFSGKPEQYELAERFLESVRSSILAERKLPLHFVLCPGNHDCDFELSNNTRIFALNGVRNDPKCFDDSILETGSAIQVAYQRFAEKLHSSSETRAGDKLWTVHEFRAEDKHVVIDSINVSWCSNLHEEPGSLIFPYERYERYENESADIRLCVLHHPLNWFNQASYRQFRDLLRSVANIVFTGHEHVGGVGEDVHSDSGHSAYIEGCVLQTGHGAAESSFNVAVLNLDDGTYRSTRYQWSLGRYLSTEEGSWSDFRSLPKKIRNRFAITGRFEQLLSDPGGVFQSRNSPLTLSDLYVYPDMQETFGKVEHQRIVSTSILSDLTRIENGVLLTGEEGVGSTSLLFILFREFHDHGLLPIYVRGGDIKGSSPKDIDNVIKRAVIEEYGNEFVEKYEQVSLNQKVLLLDDFDDSPVKLAKQRAALMSLLTKRFKYFIVTANEIFDFAGSIQSHTSEGPCKMLEYKLLPMGFTLRAKLVRRWFDRTAADGSMDEAEFLARCDQGERLLDTILARNIVPALPLYLLTLLQSFDAGASGGFADSGLGEYYDYLVREGLRSANISSKKWNSIIEFCSHLAWWFHRSNAKELPKSDLRNFNDEFCIKQHRVDFENRVNELIRARILAQNGDYLSFRYHYIYYFLKGRYLAPRLVDPINQAYIRDCCAHLYVRENANTILFLAHYASKDEMFLNCIVDAVTMPFKSAAPIELNGQDTAPVSDFIRDLPRLTYNGEAPEVMRENANRARDLLDSGEDGLAEDKNDGDSLDFLSELIALFKTVEILGQILKNQFASVSRSERVRLLQMLMEGPLRALRSYLRIFTTDMDAAQIEIAALLENNHVLESDEKRQDVAKRLLAHFLQFVSYGFLAKAVSSISSDELLEDIEAAAAAIDSPASRLIALGVKLDSPAGLPKNEIRKFMRTSSSDFMAVRILQLMTLRRLYMFRTGVGDKQWLESQKLLDVKMQQAVDYRTRKTKALRS